MESVLLGGEERRREAPATVARYGLATARKIVRARRAETDFLLLGSCYKEYVGKRFVSRATASNYYFT